MKVIDSVLWRRLDVPGHDACRLLQTEDGWRLSGTAVFALDGSPAVVGYDVASDAEWRTTKAFVTGWAGAANVAISVARGNDGMWLFNGSAVTGLEDCMDLDLGFTPATNLLQLKRLALRIGKPAEFPVAWIDLGSNLPERLLQRYERIGENMYRYESPQSRYRATLETTATGFIRVYPDLWVIESELR